MGARFTHQLVHVCVWPPTREIIETSQLFRNVTRSLIPRKSTTDGRIFFRITHTYAPPYNWCRIVSPRFQLISTARLYFMIYSETCLDSIKGDNITATHQHTHSHKFAMILETPTHNNTNSRLEHLIVPYSRGHHVFDSRKILRHSQFAPPARHTHQPITQHLLTL